jgi:hypothetical protein
VQALRCTTLLTPCHAAAEQQRPRADVPLTKEIGFPGAGEGQEIVGVHLQTVQLAHRLGGRLPGDVLAGAQHTVHVK